MPYMHDWMTGFAGQSQWIALMGVCSNSKTACVLKTAPFDNAADAHLRSRMAELHRLGLPHTFQISCPENQPCKKPGDPCGWSSWGVQHASCQLTEDGCVSFRAARSGGYNAWGPGGDTMILIGPERPL